MKERNPEDVQFSKLLQRGIMRLGESATPAEPEPFRHVLRWDTKVNRKGQYCRILKQSGALAQIEFEDGFQTWINRKAIVRREAHATSQKTSDSSDDQRKPDRDRM